MKKNARELLTVAVFLTASTIAFAAPHAHHDHGVVRLDLAIEGDEINVFMQSPLDSFVGFERAPRTDAEKKRAAEALELLRGGSLLKPNPEAECTLTAKEVNAPVLEGKAREKDGHADLEANYVFKCQKTPALTAVQTGFFDAFKHTKKVEVQIAGPKGQSKTTLTKKNSVIKLD